MTEISDNPALRFAHAPFISIWLAPAATRYTVWCIGGQPVWIARWSYFPERGRAVADLAPDSEWAAAAEEARALIRGFATPQPGGAA